MRHFSFLNSLVPVLENLNGKLKAEICHLQTVFRIASEHGLNTVGDSHSVENAASSHSCLVCRPASRVDSLQRVDEVFAFETIMGDDDASFAHINGRHIVEESTGAAPFDVVEHLISVLDAVFDALTDLSAKRLIALVIKELGVLIVVSHDVFSFLAFGPESKKRGSMPLFSFQDKPTPPC